MRPVDVYASQRQYVDHLAPLVSELSRRRLLGRLLAGSEALAARMGGEKITARARDLPGGLMLVASAVDAKRWRSRRCVYLEHGAGQTYDGDPSDVKHWGWAGARGLPQVALFLVPHERLAHAWTQEYPQAVVEAVGCPKLDAWHAGRRPLRERDRRVVALTFHWECGAAPETRSAWAHFKPGLAALQAWAFDRDVELLGHGHPRAWGKLNREWKRQGIRSTPELERVFDEASILVADNTSALYEFASLGRPVVVLNAPGYRRDVEHGLRFWSHVPGEQVDDPRWLPHALDRALEAPGDTAALRAGVTAHVYAAADGFAARRAVDAIVALED